MTQAPLKNWLKDAGITKHICKANGQSLMKM